MRSLLAVVRSRRFDVADRAVEGFESLWDSGEPSLESYWEGLDLARSASTLAALIKVELRRRFERGDRPKAADYFDRFPILIESRDRVVSLVYEEFCLLKESGDAPDSREFCDAYEPWRDSLVSQLAYHRELSEAVASEPPSIRFPLPGERFAGFQLRSILGTGGVARVYLATEDDLGGRKVALKVSSSFGREPSILANLDHRNIVPILSVVESECGLRGLCMPYRPGVTLEELIRRVGRGKPPRSARAIWEKLNPPVQPDEPTVGEQQAGWASFPIKGTYGEAVAWIGLALANAMTYLHGRGVLHRDIKPANVLLARGEGPQLLDFNLAQDPRAPEQVEAALRGGTLPYMAPEHLRAFIDPASWDFVDSAADLFSLGMVLRELLTGRPPEVPSPKVSLHQRIGDLIDRRAGPIEPTRELNPDVPPSLDSIIAKCLAFEPSDRYEGASDLAEDLGCFLAREPLAHAPNTSKVERVANWTHRNRRGFSMVAALVFLGGLAFFASIRTPISKLSEFQRAARALDSNRPEDWRKAREAFDRLRDEYPDSAWPSLYLGLALEKLDWRDAKAANEMLQESSRHGDFEAALAERLKSEPDSPTLRTFQGLRSWKAGDHEQARESLTAALRSDPDRTQALLCLADIERRSHHEAEAIAYHSRAIEVAERHKVGPSKIYNLRAGILPLFAKVAEQVIADGPTVRDRSSATGLLDRMESTLAAMGRDWEEMPQTNGGKMNGFYQAFYRGCLASCRAVLAADGRSADESRRLVEEARACFRLARASVEETKGTRRQLEEQEALLRRRASDFVGSREVKTRLSVEVP